MAYQYQQQPLNPQMGQQQIPAQLGPQLNQQQVQPLFPQPQGNVYNINSTLEVANVPCGAGVSVALCIPESVMYIKTMQNGNPLFYPYKIIPFTNESANQPKEEPSSNVITMESLQEQLTTCLDKISAIETRLKQTKKKEDDWDI